MYTKNQVKLCQIVNIPQISEKTTPAEFITQIFHRIEWAVYRRWKSLIKNITSRRKQEKYSSLDNTYTTLLPGDYVRVKSKEEIFNTVDSTNVLKGCAFMEEMEIYCGTTHRVFKRVEKFMDERDYRVKKATGIVLLEDVICQGTKIFGRCDRSCFFFWREEWLEKIS